MARYLISEAARQTGVEAHVLRFWEEELKLEIPRNEQGHRYYTEGHIEVFEQIKRMKLQGFQLKEIKEALEAWQEKIKGQDSEKTQESWSKQEETVGTEWSLEQEKQPEKKTPVVSNTVTEKEPRNLTPADKLVEFESIVYDIVTEALRNNNVSQAKEISDRVGDKVVKEMNYLMRENEEHLEAHFRKLDEALTRRGRKGRLVTEQEVAVTKVTKLPVVSQSRKKRRLFGKRRKTKMY